MTYRKKRFNLVEIVLAIGVVAIGVAGVMALLPPSLNANRDSVADTLAGEAATKMAAYLEIIGQKNWDSSSITTLPYILEMPTAKPDSTRTFTAKNMTSILGLTTKFMNDSNVLEDTKLTKYYVTSGDQSTAVEVNLWREQITDFHLPQNASGKTNIDNNYMVRVYMEISWPTHKTANRNIRYYVMELANPEKIAGDTP